MIARASGLDHCGSDTVAGLVGSWPNVTNWISTNTRIPTPIKIDKNSIIFFIAAPLKFETSVSIGLCT